MGVRVPPDTPKKLLTVQSQPVIDNKGYLLQHLIGKNFVLETKRNGSNP